MNATSSSPSAHLFVPRAIRRVDARERATDRARASISIVCTDARASIARREMTIDDRRLRSKSSIVY